MSGSRFVRLLALFTIIFLPVSPAAEPEPKEIKSALWEAWTLVQLTDYVSQPEGLKPVNRDRFVIGVVGTAEVEEMLRVVLREKKIGLIGGRPVTVVSLATSNVLTADLVYVAESAEQAVYPTLKECALKGVIVIGHSSEFFRRGGVFRFDLEKRHLVYSRDNLEQAPFGLHRRFRRYLKSE